MKTILEILEKNAQKFPDKIVFADKDISISYKDFLIQTKSLAKNFIQKGLKNKPIAVLDNRNVNTLIQMFAVLFSSFL